MDQTVIIFDIVLFETNLKLMEFQLERLKVIYVYDALCGWCYGFSTVMNVFCEKYQNEVDFEVISGGMITDNRIGPIGEVASYILSAYTDVELATGIKFGEKFLNNTLKIGTAIFTSLPPAIAMSVFRSINPHKTVQFASRLSRAIYYDGVDPENLEAYGQIAAEFGIILAEFKAKIQDQVNLKLVNIEFQKSRDLGVTGFPTLFVQNKDQYFTLARGYVNLETLESNYTAIRTHIGNQVLF